MNYLISRHAGAVEFLESLGYESPVIIAHASAEFLDSLTENDSVIGTLPIHLAESVCSKGARFFNLTLDVPAEYRGQELTVQMMREFDARITEYRIYELGLRTRLSDMADEMRFVSRIILESGTPLARLKNLILKVYHDIQKERGKYT